MNLPDFLNDNSSLDSRKFIDNDNNNNNNNLNNSNNNKLNNTFNTNFNHFNNNFSNIRRDSLPINGVYSNTNSQLNNNFIDPISISNNDDPLSQSNFNDILFNKLNNLSTNSPNLDFLKDSFSSNSTNNNNNINNGNNSNNIRDSFKLPLELRGGISNISSRRPSYAAETLIRSNYFNTNQPLNSNQYIHQNQSPSINSQNSNFFNNGINNHNNNSNFQARGNHYISNKINNNNFDLSDSFNDLNMGVGSKFNEYSQQPQVNNFAPFQQQRQQPYYQNRLSQHQPNQHQSPNSQHLQNYLPQQQQQQQQSQPQPIMGQPQIPGQPIKLENGLLLKDQYIVASQELKELYSKTTKYFQDPTITSEIVNKMNELLTNSIISKLITFIKNLNNLTFNHKILCLVINKNGKFDLLSYPNNSNIFLQKNDLVIVDGDRGKDLVMIIEPLVNLNFAILFNFLKKLEHLKSLTINDGNSTKAHGGTHPTSMNASTIINSHSNEDSEFIITLPIKQVLRFATPKEVHKISGKFLEEKKAFITCFNKIKELGLDSDLTLINVEYQCDFKKLIFYYFAGFNRIDFRGLIKELFKIYKTRIWLCAVLPFNQPELYITMDEEERDENEQEKELKNSEEPTTITNLIPKEYELSNDQILNFSITEFSNLSTPNYFHSLNLKNLLRSLSNDIKTEFFGFNPSYTNGTTNGTSVTTNGTNTINNNNKIKNGL
ncbi:hypothetical protein KGF54_004670 [Candida jiufengensis]|uniref:uncharacterized protein n=1 Tax=Candida jiufengensis TaxID=497108 RepID=UPI0022247E2B|nr:uncharacterized protein KGF54_004670 [Candida jiufengensis]KAI5951596.1 hypothetical protein KGF54_004670 [Candida jiufengensis]